MMRASVPLSLVCALLMPLGALAEPAGQISNAGQVPLGEVVRGGYAEAEVGAIDFFGLGAGTLVGVDVGWDVASGFGLGLFVDGLDLGAPSLPGDVAAVMPGVEARLYLPIFQDSNGVDRLFFGVRAGGGVALFSPIGGLTGTMPMVRAGLSLEYFTHLRHFSVGLAADGIALFGASSRPGVAVSPFARDSF